MLHVQLRLSSGLVPVVTGSLSLPLLKFSSDMLLLHLMVLRYREGIFVREADTETSSAAISTTTSSCKRSATIKGPAAQSAKRARRPKPCSSAPTEEPEGETPLEPSAMIQGEHRHLTAPAPPVQAATGNLDYHLGEAQKLVKDHGAANRGVLIVALDLPSDHVKDFRREIQQTKAQAIRFILCTKDLASGLSSRLTDKRPRSVLAFQ